MSIEDWDVFELRVLQVSICDGPYADLGRSNATQYTFR